MANAPENVMKALLNKIHAVMTNDGEFAPTKRSTFISWCLPGLAFTPDTFDYQSKGFNAVLEAGEIGEIIKKLKAASSSAEEEEENVDGEEEETEESSGGVNQELLDQLISSSETSGMLQRINYAESIAHTMDFIPTPQYDESGKIQDNTAYSTDDRKLSAMCSAILDLSKVAKMELSKKEKDKLEKFKNLLYPLTKVKTQKLNLDTGDFDEIEEETIKPSLMMRQYDEKMAAYGNALSAYNTKRMAAMVGRSKEAVLDFSLNAEIYRNQVNAAEAAWNVGGYRKEVEGIQAYIDNVTRRSMQIWKQSMIKRMKYSSVTNPQSGAAFPYTTLIPLNFASPEAAWQRFDFNSTEVRNFSKSKRVDWKAKAGGGFLGFRASGGASSSKSETHSDFSFNKFSMSFEMTQTIISRPWLPIEFIKSSGWKLDEVTWSTRYPDGKLPLSDGVDNPKGPFIAYPVTAVWVRNVHIRWGKTTKKMDSYFKKFKAGGSVGWGIFGHASASRSTSESESNYEMDSDGAGLTIKGMNLIALVNHYIGQAPNPNPKIKEFE